MTTLSQSIPNLLTGISQQPDSRKRPGQLKDAVNAFPDFALGLLKRPGGKFVAKLHNAPTTGKWFPILRDTVEKYVACYSGNRFQNWDLIDRTDASGNVTTHAGSVRVVDMGNHTGQPVACNPAEVLTEANELNAEVDDTSEALTGQHIAKEENTVLATSVAFPTHVVKITNAGSGFSNGVSANVATSYNTNSPGSKEGSGLTVNLVITGGKITSAIVNAVGDGDYESGETLDITGFAGALLTVHSLKQGTERTEEHPLLASRGYRIFEAHLGGAATHTAQNVTDAENAYDKNINTVNDDGALQDFSAAQTAETNARNDYNTDFNACAIAAIPTNTLRITQAGTGLANGVSTAQATATTGNGADMTVDVRVEDGQVHVANINAAGSNYSLDDTITLTCLLYTSAAADE